MEFSAKKELDLVCFGRAGIDMYPIEYNNSMEDVSSYSISLGGSPANIAVGASKLGCKVGFIGKISDDAMGNFVVKKFNSFNVDTSQIVRQAGTMTSLAITEVKSPEDCSVLFYRDNVADLSISWNEISEDYIANTKALLISGTALSKSPSREAVYHVVECAEKHNTPIIFEADYRVGAWRYPEKVSFCYDMICSKSDIIFGTREEFDAIEYSFDRDNKDDFVSASRYLNKKAKIVVIKHGNKGFNVFLKDGRVFNRSAVPSNIRKTFGAGDALVSAFISAIIKGKSIEEAIEDGAHSASVVISKGDCTEAMPTIEELEKARNKCK